MNCLIFSSRVKWKCLHVGLTGTVVRPACYRRRGGSGSLVDPFRHRQVHDGRRSRFHSEEMHHARDQAPRNEVSFLLAEAFSGEIAVPMLIVFDFTVLCGKWCKKEST